MSHRALFYYDQESNVSCVRDADNGLTYHTYDLLNRMTSVKNPFGEVTYYEYTPGGQVKKRTLGNSTLTYYEYDDVGRVSKVGNRKSDLSVISTFEYEHDKVGNPTKITREDGSATYYDYDRIYQLTGETQVDDQGQVEYAFEYQYDKAHNRTVKVDNGTATYYTYNEANELLTETTNGQTTCYQYDRCGNTTAKQEPAGTTYYQYDTENLMTRIDFADGSHNYFGYDADSKRVSKQDSEGYTEFIYQGPDMLKLLLERDGEGETQAHYTMGQGLEAMRRNSTSSFYHYNHLGTTHALTDAVGNVADTYRYSAWGEILGTTGETVNRHTFAGRERYSMSRNSDYALLGLRYYVPRIGRFLTMDRVAGAYGPMSYADNRPTVFIDPAGLLSSPAHCARVLQALNDAAEDVEDCPTGETCFGLNHLLYIYLHDCRGFWSPPVMRPRPPFPPAPDPIPGFGDIEAYRVWYEVCHQLDEPGLRPSPPNPRVPRRRRRRPPARTPGPPQPRKPRPAPPKGEPAPPKPERGPVPPKEYPDLPWPGDHVEVGPKGKYPCDEETAHTHGCWFIRQCGGQPTTDDTTLWPDACEQCCSEIFTQKPPMTDIPVSDHYQKTACIYLCCHEEPAVDPMSVACLKKIAKFRPKWR